MGKRTTPPSQGLPGAHLDEALELSVLLQQPRLLLLQRKYVLRRLLKDRCLARGDREF